MSATGEKKGLLGRGGRLVVKPTDPSVTPTCASCTEPCVAAAQPTHQKVAGPYPCLFLAALLCGEGTWLVSALPCGDSGLGRGRPRAPPVWGTASTFVLVEISHSAFTAIAAAASSPEVPPWVLPLSEERGVAPSYHGPHTGRGVTSRCFLPRFSSGTRAPWAALELNGASLCISRLSVWPHSSAPRQRT